MRLGIFDRTLPSNKKLGDGTLMSRFLVFRVVLFAMFMSGQGTTGQFKVAKNAKDLPMLLFQDPTF